MGFYTKATDWQVCGIANVAIGAVWAAGLYRFVFYSKQAGVSENFLLGGMGVGLGGNLSGISLPSTVGGAVDPWTTISSRQAFSAADLRGGWGEVIAGSFGPGLQFSLAFLQAKPGYFSDPLFRFQNVSGFSIGVGVSVISMQGKWRHSGSSIYNPGNWPPDASTTVTA